MDYAAWLDRLRRFVADWQAKLPPERRHECFVLADPPQMTVRTYAHLIRELFGAANHQQRRLHRLVDLVFHVPYMGPGTSVGY